MKKIGFIGCGNLTEALVTGLTNNHISGELINIFDISEDKMKDLQVRFNVHIASSLQHLILDSDMVILAVKPQNYAALIREVKDYVRDELIVSVAAGIELSRIYDLFEKSIRVIRIMPNTPVMVNAGIIGTTLGNYITSSDKEFFESVFNHLGVITYLSEEHFDAFTAICGCLPAFVYMFIEGVIKGGIAQGLDPHQTPKMVGQAVLGAAKMVLTSLESPETLRKKVTSKGGVTQTGVDALMQANLIEIVEQAIIKTGKRSQELTKEMNSTLDLL